MASGPISRDRINLDGASILLLDDTPMGMSILVQIVTGLGAKILHRCATLEEAQKATESCVLDLAIVDAMPPSGAGYEFVRWLRTTATEPNRYAPVLLTTGHTPARDVFRARDVGSTLIIRKPIVPTVVVERIFRATAEGRQFVMSDSYSGPDRRHRDLGPPNGVGRRYTDGDSFELAITDRPVAG
jgi:CheY-like chemotaxis protein